MASRFGVYGIAEGVWHHRWCIFYGLIPYCLLTDSIHGFAVIKLGVNQCSVWTLSGAPSLKSLENSGFSGFSFAFRNRFFVGRRIIEIVDFI